MHHLRCCHKSFSVPKQGLNGSLGSISQSHEGPTIQWNRKSPLTGWKLITQESGGSGIQPDIIEFNRVEEAESSQSFGAIGAGFDSQDPDIGTDINGYNAQVATD